MSGPSASDQARDLAGLGAELRDAGGIGPDADAGAGDEGEPGDRSDPSAAPRGDDAELGDRG